MLLFIPFFNYRSPPVADRLQALLTLLISNNFAEIKSSVFKKFDKHNLFQLSCHDVVERFKLALFLAMIMLLNVCQGGLDDPVSQVGTVEMAILSPPTFFNLCVCALTSKAAVYAQPVENVLVCVAFSGRFMLLAVAMIGGAWKSPRYGRYWFPLLNICRRGAENGHTGRRLPAFLCGCCGMPCVHAASFRLLRVHC